MGPRRICANLIMDGVSLLKDGNYQRQVADYLLERWYENTPKGKSERENKASHTHDQNTLGQQLYCCE